MRLIYDLYDTQISICHSNVLKYYTENFDYHKERDEFLKDFLSSEITHEEVVLHELGPTEYSRGIVTAYDLWRANQDLVKL